MKIICYSEEQRNLYEPDIPFFLKWTQAICMCFNQHFCTKVQCWSAVVTWNVYSCDTLAKWKNLSGESTKQDITHGIFPNHPSPTICIMCLCFFKYWHLLVTLRTYPDSKVYGGHIGPTWVLSAPNGPHVGPMNLAIRVVNSMWCFMNTCSFHLCWTWIWC